MNANIHLAVKSEDAAHVAMKLKISFGLSFSEHESSYKGIYWKYSGVEDSIVEVSFNSDPMFRNGDPPDEKYFQPKFKDFQVLLWATVNPALAGQLLSLVQSSYPGTVIIENDVVQFGIESAPIKEYIQ